MNYKEQTDDDLVRMIGNSGLKGWEGPEGRQAELTRRLLESNKILNKSIIQLDKSTAFYSRILIGLTIAMLFIAGIQIYLIVKPT